MKKYLLPKEGSFYKANLHSHSTLSDGALTPEEMKQLYRSNGYSILAYTDHSVFVPHNDLTDSTFLALNGSEEEVLEPVSGKVWHACFIALDSSMTEGIDMRGPEKKYDPDFINTVMERGREGGFFVTYNHPDWSMENYGDYMNYRGMHAMEIVNFSCIEEGYADYNEQAYEYMLRGGKRIFCIAADDNHNWRGSADSFGGFTMIKAPALEYKAVANALLAGDFYASQGPEIYELYIEGNVLHIRTSEAASIRFNTGIRKAKLVYLPDGGSVNEAEFEVTPEQKYVRVTVTDKQGRHANTHAYFTDEIL